VEVTIVVDNFIDLLMAGADGVHRYLASDSGSRDQLIAEHGFSDPMIWDDQNVIVNAQRLTGERRLAGFIGGPHLTGGVFEPIIEPTVDAFVAAEVGRVLPAHCIGWKAVHQLARALPNAFVQPAVGTVITF
jgi:metal-dependent hydrolase (beta-lactamase superfamily II)